MSLRGSGLRERMSEFHFGPLLAKLGISGAVRTRSEKHRLGFEAAGKYRWKVGNAAGSAFLKDGFITMDREMKCWIPRTGEPTHWYCTVCNWVLPYAHSVAAKKSSPKAFAQQVFDRHLCEEHIDESTPFHRPTS